MHVKLPDDIEQKAKPQITKNNCFGQPHRWQNSLVFVQKAAREMSVKLTPFSHKSCM